MDEKNKAVLELVAKAIGEARELFAEQRNATPEQGTLKPSCTAAQEDRTDGTVAPSPAADQAAEKLIALVDGSGLGWLMENQQERGRFLEELEARIAAGHAAVERGSKA